MKLQASAMTTTGLTFRRAFTLTLAALIALAAAATPLRAAAPCAFTPQGDGHVVEVIDGRSFRLADGREIKLAGIEEASRETAKSARAAALSAIIAGKDVNLTGNDDTPDRYGRQGAFVFLADSDRPVMSELLAAGAALVSAEITEKDCAAALMAAEAEARRAQKGTWTDSDAIKNAESADDILAGIGRFTLVEGRVLSVRQAGATTYLNFGRRRTRDFAVTIPRRMMPGIEAASIIVKSLENRRIRVRGWVEAHPGPRIRGGTGGANRGTGRGLGA